MPISHSAQCGIFGVLAVCISHCGWKWCYSFAGIRGKNSSFCALTQEHHISTIFGHLDKIYVVSRLKTSGRARSGILVSHLGHRPCLCPPFAGEALGQCCFHILRVPVPKEHRLQNKMGLHHKTCHRNMRNEKGWLGLKKVQSRGITAIHKKPNPVDPVKDSRGALDPGRKMWTPNHLGDEQTNFPALSFAFCCRKRQHPAPGTWAVCGSGSCTAGTWY